MERGEVLKRYCGWQNEATPLKQTPKDRTCNQSLCGTMKWTWSESTIRCHRVTHGGLYDAPLHKKDCEHRLEMLPPHFVPNPHHTAPFLNSRHLDGLRLILTENTEDWISRYQDVSPSWCRHFQYLFSPAKKQRLFVIPRHSKGHKGMNDDDV